MCIYNGRKGVIDYQLKKHFDYRESLIIFDGPLIKLR